MIHHRAAQPRTAPRRPGLRALGVTMTRHIPIRKVMPRPYRSIALSSALVRLQAWVMK